MNSIDLLCGFAPWTSDRTWAIVLGVLAAIVSLALLFISWTRWGQTKSLTKCVVLAVLAHVWLLMYAYGTRIIMPGDGNGGSGGTLQLQFVQEDGDTPSSLDPTQPTESDPSDLAQSSEQDASLAKTLKELEPPPLLPAPEPVVEKEANLEPEPIAQGAEPIEPEPLVQPIAAPTQSIASSVPQVEPVLPTPTLEPLLREPSQPMETLRNPPRDLSNESQVMPGDLAQSITNTPIPANVPPIPQRTMRIADQKPMPEAYQNRMSNRAAAAAAYGGDASTEASVEAALRWLAANQSPDGHWDAATYGAGRETKTLGLDRSKTGAEADTGMTGLALLAFQGAGNTHLHGPYAETIRKGLEYLRYEQMPSGDLAGKKQVGNDPGIQYARMYCHGIATFAIAEAYALTGDRTYEKPVAIAADYSYRCQNPRSGGWRYRAKDTDDPGDMSQFGWQAMALHSARSGGIQMPQDIDSRFKNFLDSVSTGQNNGLATYRPRSIPGQRASAAMTAEAMACRSLLRISHSQGADREARQMLLANLPGQGEENLYYWYYGTLAMFQLQDRDWQTWNEALKKHLVSTQRLDTEIAVGSWDPNCIWGGYGGRVYSTALSCMCLEVYYRYLPIYQSSQQGVNQQGTLQNAWQASSKLGR